MSVRQARRFRKKSTEAETKLWNCLRNRQAAGMKFRRQHPIGDRIVDFFGTESKLAIELDGSGHTYHLCQTADLDRELDLYKSGVRVLRFTNNDILENLEGVVDSIIHAVDPERSIWRTNPHLSPLPMGEDDSTQCS